MIRRYMNIGRQRTRSMTVVQTPCKRQASVQFRARAPLTQTIPNCDLNRVIELTGPLAQRAA